LYSVITHPRRTIAGVNNFVLGDKICTAFENYFPSCCTNHGGVYRRLCLVLYQLRPNQPGFVHISHPIDERNPKIALKTCDRCKRRDQKHLWLSKLANLSRPFRSEHTPCEICQNYQVEDEQPLRIIRSVLIRSGSGNSSSKLIKMI